ncbi:2-hydroxyacid dehydrogenase [Adhaeretor mobilis]|uniref:D-3-phosphoglycerate dehydrogenase n=1 Tax=Adhaeretor mobilis TaxID=1930276 RepID=A0A517MW69_9BACT|nr:NAD(P)-dependent oxidoreductase [Adhaeretor mobilis]QDS99123.1 D-3-phosphoglycerate dehydrogenase [Adhaeretor mobilis]
MERPILVCAAPIGDFPAVREHLESAFEVRYIEPSEAMLRKSLREADAYLATLNVPLTRELLQSAASLKVIASSSTGLDHLDLEAAAAQGIPILSLKEDREFLDSITATAELAWALMLASARSLPKAFSEVREGQWQRDRFVGRQLAYKTLGILGCGRLGTIMADYGRAFRMNVIGCDKNLSSHEGIEIVSFDELLHRSDVLSIHIHLTEENHGLIDHDALSRMKPGSILVNTSRGAIVDEVALIEALQHGPLHAAGVDVVTNEWSDNMREHPMIRYARAHDNLIITPHIGGVTTDSLTSAYLHTAKKLVSYFDHEFDSSNTKSSKREMKHHVHGNTRPAVPSPSSTRVPSHLRRGPV